MIIDEIQNIKMYKVVPAKVLEFIDNLKPDTPCGRYEIDKKCYAMVEMYSTKPLSAAAYEVHDKYIDIQLLLQGEEDIFYKNRDRISYPQAFDKERDIGFYNEMIDENDHYVKLDGTNFAIIFPHEGHAPQVHAEKGVALRVKKVVIKLPC